ncbi:hypothetical protein EP232_03105, partial [bacterium]
MTEKRNSDRLALLSLILLGVLLVTAPWSVAPAWLLGQHLRALIWWAVFVIGCWGQGTLLMMVIHPGELTGDQFK